MQRYRCLLSERLFERFWRAARLHQIELCSMHRKSDSLKAARVKPKVARTVRI